MNTVLKKQILGALCWEQKDSFKDLLLNLVYRIFLFLGPSKVFSIIRFLNVFIFAGIKPHSILRRTVPSAMVPSLFWVKHYLRKPAMTFLSPDLFRCPPVLTRTPATFLPSCSVSALLPLLSAGLCSDSCCFLLDLTGAAAAQQQS